MIAELLKKYQLPELMIQFYEETIRPGIKFRYIKSNPASIPVAQSKIGGEPDLPSELHKSPHLKDKQLLAQFNLEQLPCQHINHLLPDTGMLLIFVDLEKISTSYSNEEKAHQYVWIHHHPGPLTNLKRNGRGWFTKRQKKKIDPCAIEIWPAWFLPETNLYFEHYIFQTQTENLSMETWELWSLFLTEFESMQNRVSYQEGSDNVQWNCHHLLGHPHVEQNNDLESFVDQIANPKSVHKQQNWILLLQMECDENAGITWSSQFGSLKFIQLKMIGSSAAISPT